MLVKIEGRTFQVRFTHYNPDFVNMKEVRPGTVCEIIDLDHPESVDTGDAFLKIVKHPTKENKSDTFNKSAGRKVSFTNALKNHGFSRAWRTVFWKEYWKQHAA